MFLPILNFEDGYGFTYGVRVARPDPLGRRSQLSFPLTWGGDKRAAVELDKNFARGPVTGSKRERPCRGGGIRSTTRTTIGSGSGCTAERDLTRSLRVSATAGWQHVALLDRPEAMPVSSDRR